jgi:hypothetical protein
VGFSGGLVVDYPNSTRAKKYFLVGHCRLTVSKPVLKAPMVGLSALSYNMMHRFFTLLSIWRLYILVIAAGPPDSLPTPKVGRCRLTPA